MDTTPLLKHLEDVRDIYDNMTQTKGEKYTDAVRFAGGVAALDKVIGFVAIKAFGEGDQLDSFEHIVKESLASIIDMYFEAAGIPEDQMDEVLNSVKMLQGRAEFAARRATNL